MSGNGTNGNGKRNGAPAGVQELSDVEIEGLADEAARALLHVASRTQAFEMLDRGELAGTAAEAEFRSFRYLLGA